MAVTVREYETADGKIPFRDWLAALDRATRARVQARVVRFETGNLGDHRGVGGGVQEARVMFGPGYRIYFGQDGARLVLLLVAVEGHAGEGHPSSPAVPGATTSGRSDMARRSRDWNEGLAQDLQDQEFAREFLMAAMDEGVPIQVALGKVIRAMGVKEFAAKVKMAGPNVLRAINPRHNPTQDTMNRLLKPFRLKLSLARIEEPRGRHAA